MTDAAQFWDKIAPKYAKDPIGDISAYEYTLERTKSYLKPKDRVLELGSGTGSTALLLAPLVREIVAVDLSQGMTNIAKSKAEAAGITNIDFRVSTAEDAAKLSEPFDVVLGHSLFHLVRDADPIFADIYRMLPSGGIFISKTPCLADPSVGWKRFMFKAVVPVMQLIGKAPFVRYFSHQQLEGAITRSGFEVVEAGYFPAMARYVVARKL